MEEVEGEPFEIGVSESYCDFKTREKLTLGQTIPFGVRFKEREGKLQQKPQN